MSIVSSGQITITDLSDGKDGVGIQNTDITYAISTSGTTAPTTGWTSSVPSLVKGQYLWTKTVWTYTDNSSETGYSVTYISKDGTDGDDGLPGKDGVGISNTTITYAGSTSGTTAPTSGWTSTVPTVAAGSYLWTKTVWAYTDNTSETGYSVAMMGLKGDKGKSVWSYPYDRGANGIGNWWSDLKPTPTTDNPPKVGDTIIDLVGNIYQITNVVVTTAEEGGGLFDYGQMLTSIKGPSGTNGTSGIIVSSVAPASPQTGQLWQDTSTTPQLVKKWTGSEWVIWEFYAENLKANSLSAISLDLGDVNAGTYTSWSVFNGPVYDYLNGVYIANGRVRSITIENPSSTDPDTAGVATNKYVRGTQSYAGTTEYYMATVQTTQTANQLLKSSGGMDFWSQLNDTGGYCGSITAENVTLEPWQNLILKSGFTAGDGVQPQYRRIKNLDGSYSVQFRGAVKPTSGNFPTTQVQVATLSGVYLPPTNAMRQGSDNTGKGGRVAATADGKIYILAPNTSSYMYIDALTYIN